MKRLALLLFLSLPLHAATIVILGDSVAHGAGDESGLGIAGHLQRLLGHPGADGYALIARRIAEVLPRG
jgi:lysophospholipase L1-like esterase